MVRVVGIDHLVIRVSDFRKSKDFYGRLFAFMGFGVSDEYDDAIGWTNGKTRFWIGPADARAKTNTASATWASTITRSSSAAARTWTRCRRSCRRAARHHRRSRRRVLRRLLRRLLPRPRRPQARGHEIRRAPRARRPPPRQGARRQPAAHRPQALSRGAQVPRSTKRRYSGCSGRALIRNRPWNPSIADRATRATSGSKQPRRTWR